MNFSVGESDKCAIKFTRFQFPCRVCYSMTIHKSQGQTFDFVGIYMRSKMFAHGMLYTAMSRVRSEKNLYFEFDKNIDLDKENGSDYKIYNPVFKQLL